MKIGDKVKILKGYNNINREGQGINWAEDMDQYVGQVATISDIDIEGDLTLVNDSPDLEEWFFHPDWVEIVESASAKKAIGKIVKNAAGQISIQNMDGDSFDVSKYVGKTLYVEE